MVVKGEVLNVFPRLVGALIAEFAAAGVDIVAEFCGPSRWKELSKEISSKILPCGDGSYRKTFKPIASLIAKGKLKKHRRVLSLFSLSRSNGVRVKRYHIVPFGELNGIYVAIVARSGVISKSTDRIHVSHGDENVVVSKNKARLVAQGYNQQEGIDFDKTYAPVARLESIRILFAYACENDFKLFQMDVKSAFLIGFINEEVYVAQPPSFVDFEKPKHVFKLKKALYGLKQAPKAWYNRLKAFLLDHMYTMRLVDNTLFTKKKDSHIIIVQIYVDDIIFGSTCQELCDDFSKIMHEEFEMSMMGELNFFLSEFEGIPDTMCDVHLVNNPIPLEAKDHFEIVTKSNDDISSSDDDYLYNENIEYVKASPHDSELVSLEAAEIVIQKLKRLRTIIFAKNFEEIEDDNLREKLLNVHLLIANIEALKDNPTPSSELFTKSSSTSLNSFLEETNTFHNSLPEFENFYFDLGEISSGSTTTHSDISLSEYDSFIFDLTHEEFVDELTHIISPPEYDRFYFKDLTDPGELMSVLNSEIRENLLSTTLVNLPIKDDLI
nr:retrovirus-related Pol polyprotein from transposon TNT 1-94 [Tanacetum cinerariifolium]